MWKNEKYYLWCTNGARNLRNKRLDLKSEI